MLFIIFKIRDLMNRTESPTEIEIGSYLELFLYRVPKKNHDRIVQNLKQFVPWFKRHGVGIEYYQLGDKETQGVIESSKEAGMGGLDSIAKTLSSGEDEEVWIELQYFRDHKHCQDTYTEMMQDKNLEPLGNEFFGLITQGKSLVTGGFSRLKV
jgi:uncharacterized protein YbaA (DUF1428 family)